MPPTDDPVRLLVVMIPDADWVMVPAEIRVTVWGSVCRAASMIRLPLVVCNVRPPTPASTKPVTVKAWVFFIAKPFAPVLVKPPRLVSALLPVKAAPPLDDPVKVVATITPDPDSAMEPALVKATVPRVLTVPTTDKFCPLLKTILPPPAFARLPRVAI